MDNLSKGLKPLLKSMKTFRFKDDQFEYTEITHTRKVVRAILLNDKNQIALIKILGHDKFGFRDYYETPGGGIKPGETRYNALRREVEEEVGVSIKNIHFLARVVDYYNSIQRENDNYFYLCYVDQIKHQHLEEYESRLFDGIGWFSIDEAIEIYKATKITPISKLVIQRELPILYLAKKYLENIKNVR